MPVTCWLPGETDLPIFKIKKIANFNRIHGVAIVRRKVS
jgi:hypothetical protein